MPKCNVICIIYPNAKSAFLEYYYVLIKFILLVRISRISIAYYMVCISNNTTHPCAYHIPFFPFHMLTNIAARVINFIYMRKTLPKILLYRKFFCKRIVCAITNSLMFRERGQILYAISWYNVKVMSPSQLGLVFKPISIFSILNRI